MSVIARQSTARTVMVGPILDANGAAVTDGVVGDLKISKNGAAPGALNGSATLTHRNTGHYSLALTSSDLDTVGQAEVVIDDTTNAMPLKTLTVIEEAVYDELFVASAGGINAALVALKLDHLVAVAESDDPVDNSILAKIASATGDWSTFVSGTDSLEANQAEHDATQGTLAGLNNITAASVWAVVARTLTAATNITSTGGTTVPQTGDSFARIGANGASLSAIPWNASWDAEVESEVNDGLVALKLDHLAAVAESDDPVDNSILAKLVSVTGDWSTFVPGTDSLEANQSEHDASQALIATVDSVADAILLDTGTDGVIVASLSSGAVDSVWDDAITEPTAIFAWASATPRKIQQTLGVLMRNEINSDSNSVDVRNDADTLTLWSYPSSDDGATFISGEAA